MMNRASKPSAVFVSLALVLTTVPFPAFSAMVVTPQVGQTAVPGGITGLPISAVQSSLNGPGSLLTPASQMNLSGSLALPQTPVPTASGGLSVRLSAPGEVAASVPQGAPVASQAEPTPAADPQALPAGILAAPVITPQSTLGAMAEEASASPSAQNAPAARPKSLLGRIKDVLASKLSFGRVFDNSKAAAPGAVAGILPHKAPKGLEGLILDDAPAAPDPKKVSGISIESFDIPGTRSIPDIFSAPAVLKADAASEADVERALREMVDNDPIRYGVPSSELATVHVRRVAGVGHQADTIYAYFRQSKNGVEMHGSYLSFTIKVLKGQPVVLGAMAKLYPNTPVDTTPRFPDDQLADKALERLGPLAQMYSLEVEFLERKIVYSKGAWHAVNIYIVSGTPIAIAVDVASGEAFAWDPRAGTLADEAAKAQASGKALGHTTPKGPTKDDSTLLDRPLPDLTIKLGNGKTVQTDADGKFTVDAALDAETAAKGGQFSASLSGKWARVSDAARKDLAVSGTLTPGQEATVVFNPGGAANTPEGENAIAQVNGYLLTTLVHDWAKSRGLNDARIDKAIPVRVNIDDECNAYYTPGRPSLNFFKSSVNCVNSSYDTVVMHEYGHFIDDMLGGIVNGGVSEGWGDIFSMYILNNPIIGEGFLKVPRDGVDYIRHGENTYQYGEYDEVHDQGQAWGGFAWKLRKALMAKLGDVAGAALAESLVIPTMLAKAADIPAAMAQVLLSDMDQEGNMPHEAEIRGAAQAHGVTLPKNPGKLMAFARRISNWLALSSVSHGSAKTTAVGQPAKAVSRAGVLARTAFQADSEPQQPTVKAKMTFSAGAVIRGRVKRELQRFLDSQDGITYELKEYKGLLSSDFLLVVKGPESQVRQVTNAIQSWFNSLES